MSWIAGVVDLRGEVNRDTDQRIGACRLDQDVLLAKNSLFSPHLSAVVFNFQSEQSVGRASINSSRQEGRATVVVFVGRLFYRGELMSRLGSAGVGPVSDSQLVVSAYQKWGARFVDFLEGNFAFVLWDPLKKSALCCRDRQGLQALFLLPVGAKLYFATTLKMLFSIADKQPRVNEDYLVFQLYDLDVKETATSYQHAKRLTPGAVGIYAFNQLRIIRKPLDPLSCDSSMKSNEWTALARETVERSVIERCKGVAGVGAHLSGGLDSSLITGIAAKHLRKSDRSVLAINLNGRNSDREPPPDGAAIEAHCRMHPNILPETLTLVQHPGLVSSLSREAFRMIPGQNITIPLAHRIMRERLIQRGAQTVLCGWGGDQIFSNKFPHALVEALFRNGLLSGWKHLQKQAQFEENLPRRLFRRALTHVLTSWRAHIMGQLSHPQKWLRCGRTAADSLVNESWFSDNNIAVRLQEGHWDRMRHSHGTLVDYMRWNYDTRTRYPVPDEFRSLYFEPISLEYPLLDPRLIQLCLALPIDQHVLGGMTRSLARRVGRELMPESTRLSSRKGVVMPTDRDWDRLFLKDVQPLINELPKSSTCWDVLDRSSLIREMESLIVSTTHQVGILRIRRCLRAVGVALWLSEESF